ncbi:MAG: TIM barrel protein [Candidatus Aenigmarchaeota archaeon]|nr:TIM barrel protein [Candidatus Aenigmarchaeota archaeon]
MLKIGTAGIPYGCKSTNDAPKFLAEQGLGAIEIEFVRSIYMDGKQAMEFSVEAKKYDISVSVHAPYFINLNSQNPAVIEKSKAILLKCLEICDCMGATVCVVHVAYYSQKSKQETFENVKREIEEILFRTKSKTLFGVEVMGKQSQFGDLEEVLKLCSLVKGTTPVVDFAHIHARGDGCLRTKEDFAEIIELSGKYGFDRMHCHYSGILYKDGNEKKHLPIESSQPDYKLLAEVLKEKDCDLTLICEAPDPLGDAVLFKKYYL